MRRSSAGEACPSVADPQEAAVMILCVVELAVLSGDDAPRAAILTAGRFHGELAIVAALALRQPALAIAEHRAVPLIGKRPVAPDEGDGLPRFLGKRLERDVLLEGKSGKDEKSRDELHDCGGFLRRMCRSRSCCSVTRVGAPVSRSCPRCVFGKAITSRIASVPAMSATMRSRPKAMPPCGGAPNCSASSRKPNFARWSSFEIFIARNTCSCTSGRWIRTEPPPISQPFSTTS